jgi:hypothetical protein
MRIHHVMMAYFSFFLCAPFAHSQQDATHVSVVSSPSACVDESKLSSRERNRNFGCAFCTLVVVPSGFLTNASLRFGDKVLHEYTLPGDDSTTSFHLGLTGNSFIQKELSDLYRDGQKSGAGDVVVELADAYGRKLSVSLWHVSWSAPPAGQADFPLRQATFLGVKCDQASLTLRGMPDPALFVK